jgi:lipoprotein-releasing system ATP-binding protein
MIIARNLHKFYDDLEVLKGVDLNIAKGEIVSIVGASGAGKTTLLQILGTLDKPSPQDGTELAVNGEDVLSMNDKQLSQFRNKNLGFIFQFHQLLPEFTALENVCIPASQVENRQRLNPKPKDSWNIWDCRIGLRTNQANYRAENNNA